MLLHSHAELTCGSFTHACTIWLDQPVTCRETLLLGHAHGLQELEKLQDRVPAFSSQQAVETIEEGLGAPVSSVFSTFERKPLAAASLGQVGPLLLGASRAPRPRVLQLIAAPLSDRCCA